MQKSPIQLKDLAPPSHPNNQLPSAPSDAAITLSFPRWIVAAIGDRRQERLFFWKRRGGREDGGR